MTTSSEFDIASVDYTTGDAAKNVRDSLQFVIPAQAGIQTAYPTCSIPGWIPACAGMTKPDLVLQQNRRSVSVISFRAVYGWRRAAPRAPRLRPRPRPRFACPWRCVWLLRLASMLPALSLRPDPWRGWRYPRALSHGWDVLRAAHRRRIPA